MSSTIKIYGLIFIGTILIILAIAFSKQLITKEEIFENVRSVQLSTIQESINIGDLIVNDNLSINQEYAKDRWIQLFKENISILLNYQIILNDINELPGAIAVNVLAESKYQLINNDIKFDYRNIVLLERKLNENQNNK